MPPHAVSEIKILLVDDESRNLDALESVLQSSDVALVRAVTADEALMRLIDGDFAAIVLDVQMPGMNGIELANLIKQRKRTQHIPIIFLTAYFQEDKDVLLGYGIGAVDYLTKPVNPQILKMKVNVFVDLYRKTRALIATNGALELEVTQRQKAEEALREANNALEARVAERTSDLTRVNEALRVSEAHARAASRAKDDFLAALSHELRTPLSPVLLLATEGAGSPNLPVEVRADFETIAKNVALEARLIDDLLDLTRISRGKLTLDLRPTDVHVSLREALAMAREEIDQKRLVVTLDLRAGRCRVRGDDVRLKQVFWNIIKNAAKFTPNDGRITVESIETPENEMRVTVADTGIGMTPAELDRIFEAFSQGDHATSNGLHRFGGMGLGLAISRMMLELHGGSVKAESRGRNLGTTFTIRLPLLNGEMPEEAEIDKSAGTETSPSSAPFLESRRRVLLVEDHKPTSVALSQLLARRNFAVVETACVAEALGAASRESFDLLISDIGLPDGTGYELMTQLHGRHGLIGIALTGYGMEEDVSKSQAAGFVAHLTKPVTVQALDRALQALTRA
ncbi:MAG TPA: response regulator [Candidatus Didemnitutus sp.]